MQARLSWRGILISYQLADEQETAGDGEGQFLFIEWIQMHRKYQVQIEKRGLFILLAEVGS